MKRQAPSHPKMLELERLLGVPRLMAIGIMEALWHWVADYAPQGDLGRFTDAQIAHGIGYEGDGKGLIEALCGAGFVDPHDKHRLVIHDWSEHAELSAHAALARKRLRFIDGKAPSLQGLRSEERPDAKAFYDRKRPRTGLGPSKDSPEDSPRGNTGASLGPSKVAKPEPSQSPSTTRAKPEPMAPTAPEPDGLHADTSARLARLGMNADTAKELVAAGCTFADAERVFYENCKPGSGARDAMRATVGILRKQLGIAKPNGPPGSISREISKEAMNLNSKLNRLRALRQSGQTP